jgi:hypothetical protein
MLLHHKALEKAQQRAYEEWYKPFADLYGTEHEEVPHTYEWGTTYD